jgi:hypothetical protein
MSSPLICFSPNTAAISFKNYHTFRKRILIGQIHFHRPKNLPLVTVDGKIYNVSGAASCVKQVL